MVILKTFNSKHLHTSSVRNKSYLVNTQRFSDNEMLPEIVPKDSTVKNQDVIIIGSTNYPTDNLWELLLIIDAAKRHEAKSINVIIPYFGYSRQDRISTPNTPIGSKLYIDCLKTAGATKIISFDLHATQEQGFADIPFINYTIFDIMKFAFSEHVNVNKNQIIVSPDFGAVTRNRLFVDEYKGLKMAVINKDRHIANQIRGMELIGDVKDKHVFMFDDMIDTGGTLCKSAKLLKDEGALSITCFVTHPLFSNNSIEKIEKSDIDLMYVTDTIRHEICSNKIKVIELQSFISNIIRKI